MHGTLLQQGEGEAHRRRSPHMPLEKTDSDHFLKDGRTISVGDCALFKPQQDSPPFIGIIRALFHSKENNLQLRVNWLYRPAELKLGKGILLEAAPNEIFYSFHKDKIPAASLLHPCRVAFLPKGVELPRGISSFVCRRVYDIENKCLWWLTDQDYINERQEEVDQLLYKTRIEMHGTVQPSGRSPKPINCPTSTSQLRAGSDSVLNMTSFPSQVKGKKRERGDHISDPVKRERSVKTEDGDSGQFRTESSLKSEIAKITEKGGLVDSEGVEKLVHLMQPDKVEKKMDLICRSMLAGVIAATDKFDCLNRFVQLSGLLVLDEWLQNVHKGQISDGSSSKDGDKSVEEFLLVLLRALDKLPVNLNALKMCNIGRSVNHLRSHKNLEIQKKARSLVDTWKKRVEAEMNVIDATSGSNQTVPWSSRSRLSEASHGGSRGSVGSGDIVVKSSVTQFSASKTSSNKTSQGETTKSAGSPSIPVQSASSPTSFRESQPRTMVDGASDIPPPTTEDKSSSSSQSLCGKEDLKSSTAGSVSVNKVSSGGSRHRKLVNGFPGLSVSGGHKETGISRSFSLQRGSASEQLSHSGLPGEKVLNVPVVEGSIQKLIVKIPNSGRSPVQSTRDGSIEDHSIMGRRASPVLSDKPDQLEHNVKDRSDSLRANLSSDVNKDSWQSNDFKGIVTGSDDGDRSPVALSSKEQIRTVEDINKAAEVSKAASAPSGNERKYGKRYDASLCSINALIESCVKYSEVHKSTPIGDDVGMNLLASVAAGEVSKSDLVSPADSPRRSRPAAEEACIVDDARPQSASGNNLMQGGNQPNNEGGGNDKKNVVGSTTSPKDELHQAKYESPELGEDRKVASSSSEEELAAESIKCSNHSAGLQKDADCCLEIDKKLDETKDFNTLSPAQRRDGEEDRPLQEEKTVSSNLGTDGVSDACGSSEDKVKLLLNVDDMKPKVEVTSLNQSLEDESKNDITICVNTVCHVTQKSPSRVADGEVLRPHISGKYLGSDTADELKARVADVKGSRDLVIESEKQRHDKDTSSAPALEGMFPLDSAVTDEPSDETKQVLGCNSTMSTQKESSAYIAEDVPTHLGGRGSKLSDAEPEVKECTSSMAEASSSFSAGAPDTDSKMKFDLNEGFIADDGKCGEQITMTAPVSPSDLQIVNLLPLAASSSMPSSVTVAAAAKGPFVPPEDLLRSKGELGWKGSAATSAFRPAEPRKVLQTPLVSTSITPSDASTSKHGRAPLDIDLNVPDERVLEDLASRDPTTGFCLPSELQNNQDISRNGLTGSAALRTSGGLDLDLNRIDDTSDMGQCSASSSRRLELEIVPLKSLSSGGLSTSELGRDFDLNNGPCVDEANAEQSSFYQHAKGSMHVQPPVAGLRINNPETGSLPSWLPPGNSYSTVTIPSILPDRGKQPFQIIPQGAPPRMLGPAGSTSFTHDVFHGSVLSSSPTVPFPSNPFQYPVYPFGPTFPMPSATFSVGPASYVESSSGGRLFTTPRNSQLMGPVDAVVSQYPRPYVVSLSEASNVRSTESMRKWGKQGLDLNAGPGALDVQGREAMLPMVSNKLPIASSQSLADEQARIYPVGGDVLKRKEPDRGWDIESFRSKQSSWQ